MYDATGIGGGDTFLPESIASALEGGRIMNVPVMIGSNLHEGTLFAGLFLGKYREDPGNPFEIPMTTETLYREGVSDLINPTGADPVAEAVAQAAATYYLTVAPDTTNKFRNAYSMIWTDATFTCNNLVQWEQLAGAGNDVYAYWFTDQDAPINPTYVELAGLAGLLDFGEWAVGASHSFEIQYIFGTVQTHPDVTPAQRNLSDRMITYWTNFAKNGDPGEGWTVYNETNIRDLNPAGDSDVTAAGFDGAHHCTAFWAVPFPI